MTTNTLTDKEKIDRYNHMIEQRRKYSKKHYEKMKELVKLGREVLKKQGK